MKKHWGAALLSGLVLPGTGQVLNRQYLKGGILIGTVTVLFLCLLVKVLVDLNRAFQSIPDLQRSSDLLSQLRPAMAEQDHTVLWILLGMLFILWIFSIVDAFVVGKRLKRFEDEKSGLR